MNYINIETLKSAVLERQIEDIYNEVLKKYLNISTIDYPYSCDGCIMFSNNTGKLLIEYKLDENLSNVVSRAKVLCQVLFYLKKFEQDGKRVPNVIFVADKNECFVMHSNQLLKYLDFENIDWNKAPCNAGCNTDLVLAISEDKEINPFIFDINDELDFSNVVEKIKSINIGTIQQVRITEHNIDAVFSSFKKALRNVNKIPMNDLVAIFFGVIANKDEYYVHPTNKNILVCPDNKKYSINSNLFSAFTSHFSTEYTPKEKAHFASISDRLIEDTNRRTKGEFYTPTVWVDYAHQMITEQFGENWKDEYVVWDCACGTKNLTRDYRFKELYCSTLEQAELDIAKKYNQNATSFVFDFLNETDEDLENKAPNLMKAIKENKKILFFINPPYGASSGITKMCVGTTTTMINRMMKNEKIEGSELLKQFLYRIAKIKENYNLTNVNVACFTKPSWLLKDKGISFRNLWFKNFKYKGGIMFQASEFTDVSGQWGITFNIWSTGIQVDRNNFVHDLCKTDDNSEIVKIGKKTLCNYDGINIISANQFLNRNLLKNKVEKEIIYCKDHKTMNFQKETVKVPEDYIGNFESHSNTLQESNFTQFSNRSIHASGCTHPLTKSNFIEACIILAARTLIQTNWIIDKDQYNFNVEIPESFVNDCLAYSTFNNYMMSYNLDGTKLNNEFFFISHEKMTDLANENKLDETYNEAKIAKDSYLYTIVKDKVFSDEAKALFNKANDLVKKSMRYRKLYNEEHPEVQIMNWDAGWKQISRMLNVYFKKEFKEFLQLKNNLGRKIKEQVYSLGILK